LLCPGGIMAQEPSWKVFLDRTSHLLLRLAITTLVRDVFWRRGGYRDGVAALLGVRGGRPDTAPAAP
jgi:hypothetical protein